MDAQNNLPTTVLLITVINLIIIHVIVNLISNLLFRLKCFML